MLTQVLLQEKGTRGYHCMLRVANGCYNMFVFIGPIRYALGIVVLCTEWYVKVGRHVTVTSWWARLRLNRLFSRKSKKISTLRVTSFCMGNSAETGEFPAHKSGNAENISIWWRHHDITATSEILWNIVYPRYRHIGDALEFNAPTPPPCKWPPFPRRYIQIQLHECSVSFFDSNFTLLLRVHLTISQCWFRWWLCAEQATYHYLNQHFPNSLTYICGTKERWIDKSQ